jgi:hypothetical protein
MKNRQFRVFNKVWEEQYFFKDVESIIMCLIYDTVSTSKFLIWNNVFLQNMQNFVLSCGQMQEQRKPKNLCRIKR